MDGVTRLIRYHNNRLRHSALGRSLKGGFHMRPLIVAVGSTLILTACEWGVTTDVLGPAKDGQVVYATTECVTPNADGVRCDKKTCKRDADSNCADFAQKCLDNGHNYSGNNNEGTCTRQPPTNHIE